MVWQLQREQNESFHTLYTLNENIYFGSLPSMKLKCDWRKQETKLQKADNGRKTFFFPGMLQNGHSWKQEDRWSHNGLMGQNLYERYELNMKTKTGVVRQTVVKHKTDFAVLEILINARKKTL
jgi:hypothetical protein